jgi:hypothetical protein
MKLQQRFRFPSMFSRFMLYHRSDDLVTQKVELSLSVLDCERI